MAHITSKNTTIKTLRLRLILSLKRTNCHRVSGHRLVIVKRAVIGSKGGWKLSTIFMLYSVSSLVNNKITGKKSYLLDGYIFASRFETTYHCIC